MEIQGRFEAERVDARGSAEIGEAAVEEMEVGGTISIRTGTVRRQISVGGGLNVAGLFRFGSLEADGMVKLNGPATGGSI